MNKRILYGCWSNERFIAEGDQVGVLHGRLFATKKGAERHYRAPYNAASEDPIVKVTVELVEPSEKG